ncbi:MAG: hypothetical protein ABFS12_02725 [Bacteroidota bacterium]
MKQVIIIIMFISTLVYSQQFKVDKIRGEVLVQRGTHEEFSPLKKGDLLSDNDLIITESNSFIQLDKDGSKFILDENSALGLSYLKKITINELLLALAMEEIRNVKPSNNNELSKNTAVYGEEANIDKTVEIKINSLGVKKINGAKQLAKNGYKESAIIAAKETYRKYPHVSKIVEDRIYFADLLLSLELNNEALEEFSTISMLELTQKQKNYVDTKVEKIKLSLISE